MYIAVRAGRCFKHLLITNWVNGETMLNGSFFFNPSPITFRKPDDITLWKMNNCRWNSQSGRIIFFHIRIISPSNAAPKHLSQSFMSTLPTPSRTRTHTHTPRLPSLHFKNLPPQRHHLPSAPAAARDMYLQPCRKKSQCASVNVCLCTRLLSVCFAAASEPRETEEAHIWTFRTASCISHSPSSLFLSVAFSLFCLCNTVNPCSTNYSWNRNGNTQRT